MKSFFCVGVMYSGEYDACDVTLSVYPHRASLNNMPDYEFVLKVAVLMETTTTVICHDEFAILNDLEVHCIHTIHRGAKWNLHGKNVSLLHKPANMSIKFT
jgi:hypothetical protein